MWLCLAFVMGLLVACVHAAEPRPSVTESARLIPVAYDVDVAIVGGSSGAVAAAVSAAEKGARVFLAAPRPYLGEDLCATMRLWLEEGEEPGLPLARRLFAAAGGAGSAPAQPPARPPTPMHVKKTLDDALLAAKVDFLYGCYATDVLRGAGAKPCGIVMANRAGRQAVMAKVIIDATDRAWVARLAGAEFRPYPAGPQVFKRVVVGGETNTGDGLSARKLGVSFAAANRSYDLMEYTLQIPMADGSWPSFAKAEQVARDRTFHPAQVDAAEVLFQVPPDPMKGRAAASGDWAGAERLPLDAFRPAGLDHVYVLGGCADVPRKQAEKLLRPLALMDIGACLGAAAAEEAKALPAVAGPKVPPSLGEPAERGDVREPLAGVRPIGPVKQTVASPDRAVPVIGLYDVVIVGGGTGGAPAGIGAGRHGAKALVVEYLHGLGGVGTLGMITKYYHGFRGGFTAEVDKGVKELGAASEVVGKAEWWRQANRKAGTEIWFGALGCGAFVDGGTVKGVVVATPQGRGVVLAKTVIDSTGSADLAAAAGAECSYTAGDDVGIQGAGLPPIHLGAGYTNTDYMFADDTDVLDLWHLFVYAREKFEGAYDLGQLVDTRERRRIIGDVTLTPMDMMLNRTWPDTVAICQSDFDSHGFTVHPIFLLRPPDRKSLTVNLPYRALLPKGLEGILVTGLGVSAHRDAIPVIRMQPDVQDQGYAAGTAAAMVARSSAAVRQVDLKGLQRHLVEIGCLPERVLTDTDSFPPPKERVAEAVKNVAKDYADLEIVLAQPQEAAPLLRAAYASAEGEAKLVYAHILGMMGDAAGAETLIAKVEAETDFDKGWNYVGMGQYGRSISPLDSYIIALGRTRDPRAVEPILKKVALLDAGKEFSHHRAAAMALEAIGDPRAARPLADLLSKPGMTGYATTTVEEAKRQATPNATETVPRNNSLRELVVARALYRCGDYSGVGKKILETYVRDLRGHYARHAQAVLAQEK
jgi:ribulose 1,5-bisphosphate synthetase/thiazole synthase